MSAENAPAPTAPAAAGDTPPESKGFLANMRDAITGRKSAEAAQAIAEQERDTALAEVTGAAEQLATLPVITAERDKATADLAAAQAQVATLTAERDTLKKDAATAAEQGGHIAADMLAQHGGVQDPEKLPPADSGSDADDSMNRADFEKLDQTSRAEFIRNGGKIK